MATKRHPETTEPEWGRVLRAAYAARKRFRNWQLSKGVKF